MLPDVFSLDVHKYMTFDLREKQIQGGRGRTTANGTKRNVRDRKMIKNQLFKIQGTELRVDHMKIDFRLKISTVKIRGQISIKKSGYNYFYLRTTIQNKIIEK